MQHVRFATYDLTSGTAEEASDLAKSGMLPVFKQQPGFVRYGIAKLDDNTLASLSVWDSAAHADAANAVAADWVKDNMGGRISLRDNHVGDLFFDETK